MAVSSDLADLAELDPQRRGGLAGLEHGRAEPVDVRADGVEPLMARAELGAQRGGALIDGGEPLVEAFGGGPRGGGVGADAGDLVAEQRGARVLGVDRAARGGDLLGGPSGILARGRGGLAGGAAAWRAPSASLSAAAVRGRPQLARVCTSASTEPAPRSTCSIRSSACWRAQRVLRATCVDPAGQRLKFDDRRACRAVEPLAAP